MNNGKKFWIVFETGDIDETLKSEMLDSKAFATRKDAEKYVREHMSDAAVLPHYMAEVTVRFDKAPSPIIKERLK